MKKNKIKMAATTVVMVATLMTSASANKFSESAIGQGITAIINDVSGFLLLAGPIACAAYTAYAFIKRGMASENDAPMYDKRIKTAIVCGVACALTMGIIKLFASYFV